MSLRLVAVKLSDAAPARRGTALAIGVFDGLHRGHQRILASVARTARARGLTPAVVTFDPHPLRVLRPAQAPPLIATLDQRLAGFAAAGMAAAWVLRFDRELSLLSPEDFVVDLLLRRLGMRAVLVGEGFRFGHRQRGDVALLRALGLRHGFTVETVPPVRVAGGRGGGEIVSSSRVRELVANGEVARAARLLGRPFSLRGRVVPGTGTGRRLVVPTLNLACEQELRPARGVYVTRTLVGGRSYAAVTNVGVRPTFHGSRLSVESHLLRFSRTVTAGEMEVRFLRRLRGERKFASAAALRRQILADIRRARRFFRGR